MRCDRRGIMRILMAHPQKVGSQRQRQRPAELEIVRRCCSLDRP